MRVLIIADDQELMRRGLRGVGRERCRGLCRSHLFQIPKETEFTLRPRRGIARYESR
jgi:hypothetical protein